MITLNFYYLIPLANNLVVEDDPSTGPFYVGKGCYPNRDGVVQLDAAMMRGSDYSFGAVAALEG